MIALALAGRVGVRLAGMLGLRVVKDTLLRLVRAAPEEPVMPIRVLGVDDFALRKGDSYATILVDLERRRPVDVLPGRDAEPLAAWLKGHPAVEVICRDRAGGYAEGARSGAPQAQQVADAWHLWRNLAEAVEKTVGAHHHCVREAFTAPPVQAMSTTAPLAAAEPTGTAETVFVPPDGTLDVLGCPRRLVARTTERYQAVQQLLSHGLSLIQISRELRLDHSTVRRFARAGSLEELLVKAVNRVSLSFAVLLMTGTVLGDRFGRRLVFTAGLGLFTAASVACALAPGVGWLIAARVTQGTGDATGDGASQRRISAT
ncbi:transposase [Streptomyces sp. NPDC004270]